VTVTSEPVRLDGGLGQDLEIRLAEARGQLSGNDERIASFLREHLDELAFHTSESLAQGAGVSAAAVVRFARRLGYPSFRDLRDRARAQLQATQVEEMPATDATRTTLARKAQRDVASLELLPRLLDEPLAAAARVIADASATWFLANRETYGLAVYAYRLLHHAVARVHLVDPSFPDPLRDLRHEDALVACTFRPYARETLDLLAHSRTAGAQITLITDGLAHDFIEPTDIVLAVPVDSPTLFLSFTPAVCVLETLASMVAMLDADQTYDTMEASARFTDAQRLTLERAATGKSGLRRQTPRDHHRQARSGGNRATP
jgi:DNA-binding MurR/RpiR family transcriptional regulator